MKLFLVEIPVEFRTCLEYKVASDQDMLLVLSTQIIEYSLIFYHSFSRTQLNILIDKIKQKRLFVIKDH